MACAVMAGQCEQKGGKLVGRWGIRKGQRMEEFLAQLERGGEGCWVWRGSKDRAGYGRISHARENALVHRLAYELLVGPIPDGLTLDHLCRNRACYNPEHLEPVTNKENVLRGVSPSAQHAKKTHCPRGHPYAGDNLYVARRGNRGCRTCQRARYLELYSKKESNPWTINR